MKMHQVMCHVFLDGDIVYANMKDACVIRLYGKCMDSGILVMMCYQKLSYIDMIKIHLLLYNLNWRLRLYLSYLIILYRGS